MDAIVGQLPHGTTIMTINNIQFFGSVFYRRAILGVFGITIDFALIKSAGIVPFALWRSKGSGVTFLFIFFKSTHFYITL